MGFTSRTAGGAAILVGTSGGGGPPDGGKLGQVGGGGGEGGLNPPCKKVCNIDIGWSWVVVTILAMRNGLVQSCSGIALSQNPSGLYSNDVVKGTGNVVIF